KRRDRYFRWLGWERRRRRAATRQLVTMLPPLDEGKIRALFVPSGNLGQRMFPIVEQIRIAEDSQSQSVGISRIKLVKRFDVARHVKKAPRRRSTTDMK